ncbi:MAG: sugar ABC transporter permease [Microlunatus sp.]|nr:sugar ABC transporter permease [Microlunatus sp.]
MPDGERSDLVTTVVRDPVVERPAEGVRRRSRWRSARRNGTGLALLFVAPYLLLFLVFRIGPAVAGGLLSLGDYSLAGTVSWVGLENFRKLFADTLFWNALRVTVVYTAIAVPLVVVVSLLMAQLCMTSIRGIKIYRALYFLPVVTSLVTSSVIWRWLYADDGPINWLVGLFGAGRIPFLSSETMVLPSLAMLATWARFGFDMLILLAALLAIPQEYTEAAMVDGANAWQRFTQITIPQLKPALFFVIILELIQSFQVFDVIYVMTGGGPGRASYALVFFIYDQGFHYFQFGYASAAGVVLFVITLGISLWQRRVFKED